MNKIHVQHTLENCQNPQREKKHQKKNKAAYSFHQKLWMLERSGLSSQISETKKFWLKKYLSGKTSTELWALMPLKEQK